MRENKSLRKTFFFTYVINLLVIIYIKYNELKTNNKFYLLQKSIISILNLRILSFRTLLIGF